MAESVVERLKGHHDGLIEGSAYRESVIAFVYNSERIEESPLSREETGRIFDARALPCQGATDDCALEMLNHFKLFDQVLNTVDKPLSIGLVKEYHRTLDY